MDETESDYCLRLLVKAAQYYKEHMKVKFLKRCLSRSTILIVWFLPITNS